MHTIKKVQLCGEKEHITPNTPAGSCRTIERIVDTNLKRTIARRILENLHAWFEVDESREQYIRECSDWIFFAAKENGDDAGFLCLKETGRQTVELAVMGVLREYHRRGLGRALLKEAQKVAAKEGYSFMQVKTVKMGVYEDYDVTNRFYLSMGFAEFEVLEELWGKENPCQIYVMSLSKAEAIQEDL
ncbi:MAG: GNAT family N-acetyltransferase [Clostridia bacterium]|nr:GNAT family N-acetyltransferase [Clostridia bacterium]